MNQLAMLFRTKIADTVKRRSVTRCSRWAETYRVMGTPFPGKWTFKHHPWLKAMHDCDSDTIIGQKAAQMGYTEYALNRVLFSIDVNNVDCLYVLPSQKPDANDFSSARFDPALELSPYIGNLFTDVRNIGHKRSGSANLYIRGAKARASLKSIPASTIIFDEVAEMSEKATALGELRAAGQKRRQLIYLSTPDFDGRNINKLFNQSTKNTFFFKCPHCSRMTNLIFEDCLLIYGDDPSDPDIMKSYLKCKECNHKLDHENKHEWLSNNEWVPESKERLHVGWHISQLYSSTVHPGVLASKYLLSLNDPAEEQEFFNSRLGLPRIPEGSRLTDVLLDRCRGSHGYRDEYHGSGELITMGVDVGGTVLHYEIDQWLLDANYNPADITSHAHSKVLTMGKVNDFNELDELMFKYKVMFCVIDALPEKRSSLAFAARFYGRVRTCYYGYGQGKRDIVPQVENTFAITVDRTSWLDAALGRFFKERIQLPRDIPNEYREQLKALIRKYEKDKEGQTVCRYIKGEEHDHYAHARNYAEIALPLALGYGITESIGSVT